jgi:hypothetical protein
MIEDENMLTQLKKFWQEDVLEDMDSDKFLKFIRASGFPGLHRSISLRFAKNVVEAALLGKHSSAIFKSFPYACPQECWDIYWQTFIAFIEKTGCRARVTGTGEEMILCAAGDPKAETYGDPVSSLETRPAIKKLTVRCETIGGTRVQATQVLQIA